MRYADRFWLVFCTLFLGAVACRAELPADVVMRGKKATGMVEVKFPQGVAWGSAFCISRNGYFVTNAHVVEKAEPGQKVALILYPGEKNQAVQQAEIVRADKEADLALLKTPRTDTLTPLELGDSENLVETMPIVAFGYPLGRRLAGKAEEYPSISISTGHITALRKSKGNLEAIQSDASVNPGNSGGPLLNEKGQVVGIITSGIPGTTINFAIPVHYLNAFLSKPEITFTPPEIPFTRQSQEREFTINLTSFFKPRNAYTVTLTLTPSGQESRTFTAKPVGGDAYTVSAVPVLPRRGLDKVLLTVENEGGTFNCRLSDRDVRVGTQIVKLSAIQEITRDDKPGVTLTNGKKLSGTVTGLENIETNVNGIPATLNLDKVSHIIVEEADPPVYSVSYKIEAKQGGELSGEAKGTFSIVGAPGHAHEGILIAAPDSWPTSDTGYGQAPAGSTDQFVRNIAHFFTGGKHGHFLIYSTHWAFGTPFQDTLRRAGYTLTVTMTPDKLSAYDAVFVGGNGNINREALLDYLQHGGKVYVAGSTGDIPDEPGFWRRLLAPFGLEYEGGPNVGDRVVMTVFDPVPIFEGVQGLILRGPLSVRILPGRWSHTHIVSRQFGFGLWAIATTGPLAEPIADTTHGLRYVHNPANGHWYCAVRGEADITWTNANRAAKQMTYQGKHGHLVTVTSAEENQFVVSQFIDVLNLGCWMGGFQDKSAPDYREPDGGWRWVTGEKWSYTNWNHGLYQEPNDGLGGHEDFLAFTGEGRWNDLADIRTDRMQVYIVEFD